MSVITIGTKYCTLCGNHAEFRYREKVGEAVCTVCGAIYTVADEMIVKNIRMPPIMTPPEEIPWYLRGVEKVISPASRVRGPVKSVSLMKMIPHPVEVTPKYVILRWTIEYEVEGFRDEAVYEGYRKLKSNAREVEREINELSEIISKLKSEIDMGIRERSKEYDRLLIRQVKLREELMRIKEKINTIERNDIVRDVLVVRYSRALPRELVEKWDEILEKLKISKAWIRDVVADPKPFAAVILLLSTIPRLSVRFAYEILNYLGPAVSYPTVQKIFERLHRLGLIIYTGLIAGLGFQGTRGYSPSPRLVYHLYDTLKKYGVEPAYSKETLEMSREISSVIDYLKKMPPKEAVPEKRRKTLLDFVNEFKGKVEEEAQKPLKRRTLEEYLKKD